MPRHVAHRIARSAFLAAALLAGASACNWEPRSEDPAKPAPRDAPMPRYTEAATYGKETGLFLEAAFSPDGKILLGGDASGILWLWSRKSGEEIRRISAHDAMIEDVAWSPDGGTIVSVGGTDRQVRIWDATTGTSRGALEGQAGPVKTVAYSPDGKRLASGAVDETIWIWDVGSKRAVRTLAGHGGWISVVRFSPDGKRLASGSYDRSVRLWSLDDGKVVHTFTNLADGVSAVAFDSDGSRLAADSGSNAVVWDTATGKLLKTVSGSRIEGPTSGPRPVLGVAFDPGGRALVTSHRGGDLALWDLASEAAPVSLGKDPAFFASLAFGADGKALAVAGSQGLRIWTAAAGK